MKPDVKYIVYDEYGPVRKFYTKSEAARWVKTRPECRMVAAPKKNVHEPSVFETTPAAVF